VAIAEQHFAGPEVPGSQELEMYDTWNDPYEIHNLANDKGYQALVKDLLAWLYEREKAKYSPVHVPAYGAKPIITHIPELPSAEITNRGLPSPWINFKPGSYLVVPFQQPTPTRFLYEGALPHGITGSKATPADVARFFCELHQ
jgi:hypothetical protein